MTFKSDTAKLTHDSVCVANVAVLDDDDDDDDDGFQPTVQPKWKLKELKL